MQSITKALPGFLLGHDVVLQLITALIAVAVVGYGARLVIRVGQRPALCPPGPPTLPILGNAHIFPMKRIAETFSQWSRQYGSVFSLQIMNHTVIVLNTPSAMKEVFFKNGVSSSNRPASTILNRVAPDGLNMGMRRHADEPWKAMKKASLLLLSARNFRPFYGILHAEATQMMTDLLLQPEAFMSHCERFTTSFALAILYGARAPQLTSPDIRDFLYVNGRFMNVLDIMATPPVDLIPLLKYVPRRFAGWKREADAVRELQHILSGRLLQRVKSRLARGEGNDCFMEQAVRNAEDWDLENEDWLSHLGGTLLEGSFTTAGVMQTLILTAVAHPEAQAKAADELERVIGSERVPLPEDLKQLPYTVAFIKESQRLYPIVPLGAPHEMTKDTVIDGYQYPKDAIVFMNTWRMNRDERYFDRPDEFMPERFLDNPHGVRPGCQDDPARTENLVFGGGLRICPGIPVAKAVMDIAGPYVLWAFEFKPPLDPVTGSERAFEIKLKPGITTPPLPVDCRITPRSASRGNVIRREFSRVAAELQKYELEITDEDARYNREHRDAH